MLIMTAARHIFAVVLCVILAALACDALRFDNRQRQNTGYYGGALYGSGKTGNVGGTYGSSADRWPSNGANRHYASFLRFGAPRRYGVPDGVGKDYAGNYLGKKNRYDPYFV